MMKNICCALALVFFMSNNIWAQPPSSSKEYNAEYAKRIKKTRIDGTYIPKDIDEAFVELKRLSSPADLKKFKEQDEVVVAQKLHFGLGRWMMINWSFYEGSRYSHYLKGMGVTYPDDMAQFTMRLFHRHLNNRPLEVKALAEEMAKKRKLEFEERLKDGEVIHEERRKRED